MQEPVKLSSAVATWIGTCLRLGGGALVDELIVWIGEESAVRGNWRLEIRFLVGER